MRYLIIISFSFVLFSCSEQTIVEEPESFSVTSPIVLDTSLATAYVGEVSAIQNVEIRSRVRGYISANHVDEGKMVAQGQLLFSIENSIQREELAKASALLKSSMLEAKTAEIDFKNTKQLVEKNVVSATELELSRIRFESAQAKVEEAQANESFARTMLSYTEIRAPFSGIISRIPFKIGSLVEEGTMLTTISNLDEVFVYFSFTEREYLNYLQQKDDTNKSVRFVMANSDLFDHRGVIETTAGEISTGTGTITFRARFPNPDRLLRHGATGKIQLFSNFNGVMLIPQKSVFEIQDKKYVYVVGEDGKVRSRVINVQKEIPDFYIIVKNLDTKDKIVYEGAQLLREETAISAQFVSMREILRNLSRN
jgi:RND family efflux transporter MFP subunit